jgi:hypothetical protein
MRINFSVLARETPSTSAVSAAEANPLRMIALDNFITRLVDNIFSFHRSQFSRFVEAKVYQFSRYTRGTRCSMTCWSYSGLGERPGPCKYNVYFYGGILSRR